VNHEGTKDTKMMRRDELEHLAKAVVDAAFAVHSAMEPGLLKSTCKIALSHELKLRGIPFQKPLGFLINCNIPPIRDSIRCRALQLPSS